MFGLGRRHEAAEILVQFPRLRCFILSKSAALGNDNLLADGKKRAQEEGARRGRK
jgi:hypothetical protein